MYMLTICLVQKSASSTDPMGHKVKEVHKPFGELRADLLFYIKTLSQLLL